MKWMRFAFVLSVAAFLNAAADDFSGTWKAEFTGPTGKRPKMVSEMVFSLKVDGNKVTGMAHMADWPGDAPITTGKIDGDHITFTVTGKSPWKSTSSSGAETSGYPKLLFDGTLQGDEIDLKLNWGNILTNGEERSGDDLDMKAKKIK